MSVEKTKHHAVQALNSSNIIINNLNIKNAGEDGIYFSGKGNNINIYGTQFSQVNNNGLEINGYTNVTIKNNVFKNIATIPGLGKGKDGQYFCVFYVNNNFDSGFTTISNNIIDSVGYLGIRFQSSNILVKNNVISNFNLIKSDGGGIYTFNGTNQKPKPYKNEAIIENIIMNGGASFEGSFGKFPETNSNGIYMDLCSQNVEIKNNTIINCKSSGIYMIGANNLTITGNLCYNNGSGIYLLDKPACGISNNFIQNNVFYTTNQDQLMARFSIANTADIERFGSFNNNHYIDNNRNSGSIFIKNTSGTQSVSLKDWQQKFQKDQQSEYNNLSAAGKKTSLQTTNSEDRLFFYNTENTPKVYYLKKGIVYADARKTEVKDSIVLKPFTSILLFRN